MTAMQDPTCNGSQEINPNLPANFGEGICATMSPYFDQTAACVPDLTEQIPQEEVGIARPIPSLPGCNPLWAGPGLPATKTGCSPEPATPKIGNPSRIFSLDSPPTANIPAYELAIYDGFNSAAAPTPGPASGTMYLTTGQYWNGSTSNWSWGNGVCATLYSPL
jgi:hypothetical protein